MKRLKILSAIGGGLVFVLLNYTVLSNLLIADPCKYHTEEPGILINLFYDFPSYEGYHPVPSFLSLILSFSLGFYLILWLFNRFAKRQ